MTVYEGQPTLSVDPEASLRAELLGQIAAEQFDVESAITEVMRSGADVSALANQAQLLQQLQKQIGSAGATTLIGLRAEIASAVATTQAVTQQARSIVATAAQAAAEALGAASANSRATVSAIMRDMHRFDPYLHFASAEDEAEYRRREAETRRYIDAQHAKGTPEGNLNAAGAAIGQMADAKAHGAGDSPEFESRNAALVKTADQLREALRATGSSTKEFDDRLRADTHIILRSKGMSQAEIDAHLAAHAGNPIDGITTITSPSATVGNAAQVEAQAPISPSQPDELADIAAALKAAGVAPVSKAASIRTVHKTALAEHNVANNGRC